MRVLILPLVLAATSASAAPPAALPEAPPIERITVEGVDRCTPDHLYFARTPPPPEQKKLGELPPGDLILGVYNQVDGCVEPVIVRYGDGRKPGPATPPPVRPGARVWR